MSTPQIGRGFVVCPATITSPGHTYGDRGINLPPNHPCGERCEVVTLAAAMHFKCPRGHSFYATASEVRHEG